MAILLDEARRHFDYIIIDAPPLGVFTDANLLINRADGALLVVRSGKTRYAAVDRLLEQLPRERMLGVVLNRAEASSDEAAYYYQQQRYAARPEAVEEDESTRRSRTRNDLHRGGRGGVVGRLMNSSRLKARTILLLLVEAMLLFGGLVIAVYVRMGAADADDALINRRRIL